MPDRLPEDSERIAIDEARVKAEYIRRASDPALGRYYGRVRRALARQHLYRRLLISNTLRRTGSTARLRILDVGCGSGADLFDLAAKGFNPRNLFGIDILANDIVAAQVGLPLATFMVGNAAELPFPDKSFDAVLQTTVLSSIVDREVRSKVAFEMTRVVRPGGLLISADLRVVGHGNPNLVAIDERELRAMFSEVGDLTMIRYGLNLRIASSVSTWVASWLSRYPPLLHFIFAVVSLDPESLGAPGNS